MFAGHDSDSFMSAVMNINDKELNIKKIIDVTQGIIPCRNVHCEKRENDGFIYVLSGSAAYTFKEKSFTVKKGDVFYLSKDSTYDIHINEFEYGFIYTDFLFDDEREKESGAYSGNAIAGLEGTFSKMLKLWSFGNFSDKIICKSLIYEIYAALVREAAFDYVPEARKKRLERAMKYFSENYSDPELTVSELSEICGLSEGHFRRIFFKVYHMPPIRYISLYRLNKARQMLVSASVPISEIALKCGFNSVYYFDRVFLKEWGVQPGKYRNRYMQN